jgi:disulfide bond formation protein DsbB
MLRIALFILLAIIIVVAVYAPKFRRSLGMILVVLMAAIGFIIWQDTQERDLEFERIPGEQAQLSRMQARAGLNTRSFVVSGRLQNVSPHYTIFSMMLQATIKDCDGDICKTVGQEKTMIPMEVPPEQARDFSVTIPFSGVLKVQEKAVWEYEILLVRAR